MQIFIQNEWPKTGIDETLLSKRARKILSVLGYEDAELSILLCDDERIAELHGEYFDDPTPTNVISFAQLEGEYADVEPDVLGDVVISVDTARRDALEAGADVDDELAYLMIHGVLHLLGYDHEGDRSYMAPEMEARERELFAAIGCGESERKEL